MGTVAQTFDVAPAATDRTAQLDMFFSSVEGEISGEGPLRPSTIEITVEQATGAGVTVGFEDITVPGGSFLDSGSAAQSEGFDLSSDGTIFIIADASSCGGEGCADNGTQTLVSTSGATLTLMAADASSFIIESLDLAEGVNNLGTYPRARFVTLTGTLLDDSTISETFELDGQCCGTAADFETFTTAALAGQVLKSATISAVTATSGPAAFSLDNIVIAAPPAMATTTLFINKLSSNDGEEWDTVTAQVDFPAGANRITVQAFSRDDEDTGRTPASFAWTAAALSVRTAAIGDFVWEDCNGNGIQDDAAIPGCDLGGGIPDVPVELRIPDNGGNCTGKLVDSTTTGDNGDYLFTMLVPGEYCVAFPGDPADVLTCPVGSIASYTTKNAPDSTPANDSNANPDGTTDAVALDAGESDLTVDAGLFCSVSIGDTLWNDLDRDGIQDDLNLDGGEPGFNDVTVALFDCDNNPVGDSVLTGPAPADATPPQIEGGAGWYQFDGLVPGCYVVQFGKPDGYVFSDAEQGSDPAFDSNVDPNGASEEITLLSGESAQTIDAGINLPATAGLGDFVFEDLNRNGIQDQGEAGIPDVPVNLTAPGTDGVCGTADDGFVGVTFTDVAGAYSFNDLVPGAYCVEFDKSMVDCTTDGFELGAPAFSPQGQGDDPAKDSNPNPDTGVTDAVGLSPNEFDPTIDAGIYCPAKLGDRVFKDCNGDGI
ncbi:MAG: SdrD B-like domain-containing protein, partial [Thiohalocapsa sp.]